MTFLQSRNNSQIELSPKEMLEISQEISREFVPGALINSSEPVSKIKLSPGEMFEISEEIRLDFAPSATNNTQELVLLPVDPDHLYAYWSLGDDKPSTTAKNDFGSQLTLRIYLESNKNIDITKTKSWFDVSIKSAQSQQKVLLPARAEETLYCATIGKRYPDNSLAAFAYSNITHAPPGQVIPDQFKESRKENQIVFKAMPAFAITHREISHYPNNNASGQGNNQQAQ